MELEALTEAKPAERFYSLKVKLVSVVKILQIN